MKTTSLIVEFVIIGFQVIIWFILAIIAVLGYEWINLDKIKDWITPLTLTIISFSYTLGIIFDSLNSSIFAPWSHRTKKLFWMKESFSESPSKMRAFIMINFPDAFRDIESKFNQNRLLRASILNMFLICVFLIVLYFKYFETSALIITISIILIFILLFTTYSSWYRTLRGYYFNLVQVYECAIEN